MRASIALALLLGLTACAGRLPAPPVSEPSPEPAVATDSEVESRDATDELAAIDETMMGDSLPHLVVVDSQAIEAEAEALLGGDRATWDIDVESFQDHGRVQYYLDFFMGPARDRFAIWLTRLPRYEAMIRESLRAKGLPEDLVYLALIESGYSNTAVSRARAVGMWQFIAGTGRGYGLRIDQWVDERRDPFLATEAAANHLADLSEQFQSYYLAAAAYNAGAGRITRGLARLASQPDTLTDDTFFELASQRRLLRRETRDYVPKLIAAALIAKEPARYGFTPIDSLEPLRFDEVTVPDVTGLDVIADLADTSLTALRELNPHLYRGITPPRRTVAVRVPEGRGAMVAERYAALPVEKRVRHVEHFVQRGETLSHISQRYRVSVSSIQAANPGVRPRALRIGQRLVIPLSVRGAPTRARSAPPAGGTRTVHRVRAGETMSELAERYGVGLSVLLRANGMHAEDLLRAGSTIRIPRD
jgi:membrane-bound lytic murein transglycosylase D